MTIEVVKKSNNRDKKDGKIKSVLANMNKNRHRSGDTVQNQKDKYADNGCQHGEDGKRCFPCPNFFLTGSVR